MRGADMDATEFVTPEVEFERIRVSLGAAFVQFLVEPKSENLVCSLILRYKELFQELQEND
jgi:hypothetical protein